MSYLALRFDAPAADADARGPTRCSTPARFRSTCPIPSPAPTRETPLFGEPGEPRIDDVADVARRRARSPPTPTVHRACVDVAAGARALPVPAYETYPVADEDWVRKTQAQFGPIEIAPGFFIVPSWSEPPRSDALNLRLDPGLAFGTGSHPTTRLCLDGCASAIARRRVACSTTAAARASSPSPRRSSAPATSSASTSIRRRSRASTANARTNGVDAHVRGRPTRLGRGRFDIVVANILANPLIAARAGAVRRAWPTAAAIALSGILAEQADEVRAAYAPWFTLAAIRADEGWVLLDSRT